MAQQMDVEPMQRMVALANRMDVEMPTVPIVSVVRAQATGSADSSDGLAVRRNLSWRAHSVTKSQGTQNAQSQSSATSTQAQEYIHQLQQPLTAVQSQQQQQDLFEKQQLQRQIQDMQIKFEEQLQAMERESVANEERFRSSMAQLREEMQILEYTKDEEINSLRLSTVGGPRGSQGGSRDSQEELLSQFHGVHSSTAIGRSSLKPPQGGQAVQQRPTMVNIPTPIALRNI